MARKTQRNRFGRFVKRTRAKVRRTVRKAKAKRRASRKRRSAAPAKAPPARRSRRTPEGVFQQLTKAAIPTTLGIVAAGVVARLATFARTPEQKALATAGVGTVLALGAAFVARQVPLRVVSPAFVKGVAGGLIVDAVFRGTEKLRAASARLPEAARRPGGLLAGGRAMAGGYPRPEAPQTTASLALARMNG